MLSPSCKKKISTLKTGGVVSTVFYDDAVDMKFPFPNRPFLMVARANDLAFDDFMMVLGLHKPLFIVPPFDRKRDDYTSMASERTRAQMPPGWDIDVGTVLPEGRDINQVEFLAWATTHDYAPIVIPPDPRKPRSWQINQFHQHRVLDKHAWYHLAGTEDTNINLGEFPGTFTWGVGIE